ncbi:MAG: DUF1614 domain-containing protein [Methanosarcinales archaeon]
MSKINYLPIAFPFIVVFFFLLVILLLLAQIGIIGFAFYKLGFRPVHAFLLLFLSLIGSSVNIPVKEIISERPVVSGKVIRFYGIRYIIPALKIEKKTIIAVNFGGAIIPLFISAYLLFKINIINALIGIFVMSMVAHSLARPVKGLGIAMPALIPPLIAALIALIISTENAALLAYVSGTFGVLIGADLLNLNKVLELDAPIVSIGGAGTFDGIFLTGIISALLA